MRVPMDSVKLLKVVACAGLVALLCCSGDENPTPVPPGSPPQELALAGASVMIGAGDIAVCGTNGDEATGAIVDSVVKADSVARVTTVVFTIGDNAYPSGSGGVERDFQRCFTGSWGKDRIMKVIRPSPGNHDYDSGTLAPYFAFFGDRAGPAGKGYYSYDVGGWHVIAMNSEVYFESNDPSEAKAQEDWLRKDLAEHRSRCALAYFHRPLFSSGTYGPATEVLGLWRILFAGGVDLVLNGHEHDYERFLPQTPLGVADSVNGVEEIIAGTGGGVLRMVRYPVARNSAAQIHGRFGVLKLILGAGEYSHAFIDTNGRVWDPSRRKCH
ncbi:MAG: alkaline phosphatase [Gemmatimonadetes bacterium]|nr:MAG: alkaline phosphatase [Gemmatimonadota bacterium]PYP54093.1 MAG: alkaline phosphatase [Gemmatimonadota bacterium]